MLMFIFVSHAHFCNRTLISVRAWKPHPFYKIRPFTGVHRATPIDRLLLQAQGVLSL